MILQRVNFVSLILIFAISVMEAAENCEQTCKTSKLLKSVPYPFGFSKGCPIQLHCDHTTESVRIGEFDVQNVTADSIFVNLPEKCNRQMNSLLPLFNHSYGMTSQNSLLFHNCTGRGSPNNCVVSTSLVQQQFNSRSCDNKSNHITCYSFTNTSETIVLNFKDLYQTGCTSLLSSFALNSVGDSGVSLEFRRVELAWWLPRDDKNCSKNAVIKNVSLPTGGHGFRCICKEGFQGDGFAAGTGCLKTSDCNSKNYLSGRCGGTKVGALVGGLIAGASIVTVLALICYCIRRRSPSFRNQLNAKRLLFQAAGNSSVPFYPYKEIERATCYFSEKQRLGTGAYGTVYAGKLHNDEWVAIKRFRYRDTDSIDQVMNEIKLLSSVSHPNLVRLLGCCIQEGEPILVYEFMPNGTLSQHLQRERGSGLPWTIRLTIATETARAIAYLHSVMNPPIYHRDIKSSNILLDFNFKSKVADFGLSRLGMTESSHISTAPQGTPGYLDPQYHQYFHLSDKSDVYSFGVVLVEIITALKVVDFSRPHSEVNLAALAIDRIGRGCVDEIIDPYLEPNRDAWTLSSIHNVAELAFRCLAFHRDMRPTMTEVAEELEHIRVSSWASNIFMASPQASCCSSSDFGSERSLGSSMMIKKAGARSQRLIVPAKAVDCLATLDEVKDSSPVSVQDPWLSEQSSPSTNSLLGNVVQ
ncbi:wall-associated receptor kinase-like 14 isoform X2 [Pistacia vera]|uniref:wall-associated receptor kinase-like 14 isoform X2 n=1 Tax=Pistacia vera TaxID=55513 RepID=UPI0012635B97|nr:wall-associated receptor kinase-like 14 isoform X2 [Pistacia vera]